MTIYNYLNVSAPDGKIYVFAIHDEQISERAANMVSLGAYDDIDIAVAEAEEEAAGRAVAELGGPVDWWAYDWQILWVGDQLHPDLLKAAGGPEQVRWADAMPDLP